MHCIGSNEIKEMTESGYFLQRTHARKLSDRIHSHEFYELIYVASGSCVHECDGECDNLSVGDFVVIVPNITHRFTEQSEDCDLIAISVVGEEMKKFMFLFEKEMFLDCFKTKLSPEQRNVFMLLYEKNVNDSSIAAVNKNRAILNQLLLFCINPVLKNDDMPPSFADAIEQIQKPEFVVEGVTAFLKLSGYSHSQICRLTKKYFNVTPTEYVNRIKMNYAYRLIADTNMDYETICDEVGFESFSYFCKLFKKYFGCSVATLRKRDIHIKTV